MPPLSQCLCCGIHQGAIAAANYAIIAYGSALGLTVWWVMDSGGVVPLPTFVLLFLYLVTFVASVVCVLSLSVQRKATVVAAWVVLMGMFLLPECGLNVWISLFILTSNTAVGLAFLLFYIFRAVVNIVCMVCMHSLHAQWTHESQQIKRSVNTHMMYDQKPPQLLMLPPPPMNPMITYPSGPDQTPKMVSSGETINYTVEEPGKENEQALVPHAHMPMLMPPPYSIYATMPWYTCPPPGPPLTAPPRTKRKHRNAISTMAPQYFMHPPTNQPMMMPITSGFQTLPAKMDRQMTLTKVTMMSMQQQRMPKPRMPMPIPNLVSRPALPAPPMPIYDIGKDTETSFDKFASRQQQNHRNVRPSSRPVIVTDSSTTDETGYHSRRSEQEKRRSRRQKPATRPFYQTPSVQEFYGRQNVLPPF